jgi:hypothetical protein
LIAFTTALRLGRTWPGVACQLAIENNLEATDKQKLHYDATATHHNYHEGQFVLLEDFNFLNKNRKLAPKFSGPFRILQVKGDHNLNCSLPTVAKLSSTSLALNRT